TQSGDLVAAPGHLTGAKPRQERSHHSDDQPQRRRNRGYPAQHHHTTPSTHGEVMTESATGISMPGIITSPLRSPGEEVPHGWVIHLSNIGQSTHTTRKPGPRVAWTGLQRPLAG